MADSGFGIGAAVAALASLAGLTWFGWKRWAPSAATSPSPPPAPGVSPPSPPAPQGEGELREAVKTPASPREMFAAFKAAWPDASRESILVLMAQWGIETGDGSSMWNYNVGNVKRMKGHPWMMLKNVWEILNGKKEVFNPPHPQTHFRAFDSLESGVREYLRVMRGRFAKAWPYVEKGDPEEFSRELKRLRYYTADEAAYTKAIKLRYDAFDKQVGNA